MAASYHLTRICSVKRLKRTNYRIKPANVHLVFQVRCTNWFTKMSLIIKLQIQMSEEKRDNWTVICVFFPFLKGQSSKLHHLIKELKQDLIKNPYSPVCLSLQCMPLLLRTFSFPPPLSLLLSISLSVSLSLSLFLSLAFLIYIAFTCSLSHDPALTLSVTCSLSPSLPLSHSVFRSLTLSF